MSRVDDAVRLFDEGKSCSQAVFVAFAPSMGLDSDRAMRIAGGFGSGMRLGGACGAATGAIMVLGLAFCDDDCGTGPGRARVGSAIDTFVAAFRERVGGVDCPEIIGCDVRSPEGKAAAKEEGLFATRCLPAVRTAAEILEEMLAAC